MADPRIIVEERNRTGLLTLNRPDALNAISYEMFAALSEALTTWEKKTRIYGVVLQAQGERAFCAGGDVREVHDRGRVDTELAREFLRREYSYNWQLENFTKPHVALVNGMTLGGGVGISLYGTHCVAGEKFSLAMPETAIGFIPDVGATCFFGRMPGTIGLYLALTGRRIDRADAYYLGLVTHVIDAAHFPAIVDAMSEAEPVDQILDGLHQDPGKPALKRMRSWIEAVFSASTLKEIFSRAEALADETDGWSSAVREELGQKSPTSLYLTHELWKRARGISMRRALETEYLVAGNLFERSDFYEGIRAVLIDKDRAPIWHPDDINGLSREEIEDLMKSDRSPLNLTERQTV